MTPANELPVPHTAVLAMGPKYNSPMMSLLMLQNSLHECEGNTGPF